MFLGGGGGGELEEREGQNVISVTTHLLKYTYSPILSPHSWTAGGLSSYDVGSMWSISVELCV